MVTTPPCSSDGLTIREASAALGISPTTVRRRIKAGALLAREVPTTQGYEWRVFLAGGQVPTAGEQGATTGVRGDDRQPGAWEPLDGQYRVTPEAIERAVERTGSKYVADVQALFDRVGALYEAQLAAKDQALVAQAGQLAAQAETLDALRQRAAAAEAARDARRPRPTPTGEDGSQTHSDGPGATGHAGQESSPPAPAPTLWQRLRNLLGDASQQQPDG